jgi:hypothetical protein
VASSDDSSDFAVVWASERRRCLKRDVRVDADFRVSGFILCSEKKSVDGSVSLSGRD